MYCTVCVCDQILQMEARRLPKRGHHFLSILGKTRQGNPPNPINPFKGYGSIQGVLPLTHTRTRCTLPANPHGFQNP